MEEDTARDRVIMINRMKGRLISEWHPVLDVLLKDYERGLKQIDLERDGPDDDEKWGNAASSLSLSAGDESSIKLSGV